MSTEEKLLAGRYRLIRSIGEGGAGVVYEALHEDLGKRVAVKLLHPNRAQDETVSKRFKREARAIAAIGHRAIVDVYDIGRTDDGELFLVMELLKGMTLRELLRKEGLVESSLAAYVTCSVLSALEAAHYTGIVHRDIKPENIFLVRTGQPRPAVKLLDFGVSRFTDPALEDTKLTQSNAILGTPLYMSPEQAAGQRDIDHLTDIYAIGAVMYECLTGRPPFMADNLLALAAKIQTEHPLAPSELLPDIHKELEAAVLKAIDRDREIRFQSASDFLDTLLPIIDEVDKARISRFESQSSSAPSNPVETDATTLAGGSGKSVSTPDMPEHDLTSDPAERAIIEQADTLGPTVNNAEPVSGQPSQGRSRQLIVMGTVATILLGAILVISLSPWDSTPTGDQGTSSSVDNIGAPEPAETTPEASPIEASPIEDGAPQAAPSEEHVQVTLEGVPEGATIRVDGRIVDRSSFTLLSQDRDVPVVITAAGHSTWRGSVSARENGTERVRMRLRRPHKQPHREKRTKTLPSFGEGP